MARPFNILCSLVLAVVLITVVPVPVPADDMVLFKNGRTLRADELELKDGAYRITTMSGGVMEIPVQLVERVISCVVDKDVEEQRGTDPADSPVPGNRGNDRSNITKIPPAGMGGAAGRLGRSSIGGGKAGDGKPGSATVIPPRGGRVPGKTGGDKSIPEKGKDEGKGEGK